MKLLNIFIGLLICTSTSAANNYFFPFACSKHGTHQQLGKTTSSNSRSAESIDVQHYTIDIDVTDFSGRTISATTEIEFTVKTPIQELIFDFEGLNTSEVQINGAQNQNYEQLDQTIVIQTQTLNPGQTHRASITYSGTPKQDPSGFGGWYWSGTYSYNLGVAFQDAPHNYGRIWFPCIDNFTDRATYDFNVTTPNDRKAFAGGNLINTIQNGATTTWEWSLTDPIPTYLASVAVADYATVRDTFNGLLNDFEVQYGVRANDSTRLKQSFENFEACFEGFEQMFGPYQWQRVGFVIVPFNGGAMEHATNIAYPRFAIDGNDTYESLMAHEFAHHWWGDLVTCSTAEDMWLNEGWASYSEQLFFESVYGSQRYKLEVRDNHIDVLENAHVRDEGYHPVSGVPHELTYGATVYNKGSDMMHTFRTYVGFDFFNCLTDYADLFKHQAVSTEDVNDFFSVCANKDLSSFFEDWIYTPGFPHFEITHYEVNDNGLLEIEVRQKLLGRSTYSSNVPVSINVYTASGIQLNRSITCSDECSKATLDINGLEPIYVGLDVNEGLSDATVDEYEWIFNPNVDIDFDNERGALFVDSFTTPRTNNSALVRLIHNYVEPTAPITDIDNIAFNQKHYWTFEGLFDEIFGILTLSFDGSLNASGELDRALITGSENDIRLYHKPLNSSDWAEVDDYFVNTLGNSNNGIGEIDIENPEKGHYVLAYRHFDSTTVGVTPKACISSTALWENEKEQMVKVTPNPSSNLIQVDVLDYRTNIADLIITDLSGRIVLNQNNIIINSSNIDVSQLSPGVYSIQIITDNQTIGHARFVKQ